MPASFRPDERSPGLNLIASSATKIGTEAFAIAATPESMCFSPQAISVNGIDAVDRPEDHPLAPGRPHLAERLPRSFPRHQEREQQQPADQQPQRHEHGRLEVADADLDEEVRGAPDRREQEDQGEVGAGGAIDHVFKVTPADPSGFPATMAV